MYESFFGLHEPAFSLTPDPRFLWFSETHQEGLAALCYAISARKGISLLTGEVGAGKTTLLKAAIDRLPADLLDVPEVAFIRDTAELTPLELLKFACAEFRLGGPQWPLEHPLESKADFLVALNAFLVDRHRSGLTSVLILDEAQNLSLTALEQVRLLSNLELGSHKLLEIVLTGQPELRRKLMDPRLRQLRHRIAIEYHVAPLRPADVAPYLRHRIHVAGGRFDRIFAPGVEPIFAEFASGCPRLINLLADHALLSAFAKRMRPVVPALVELKAKQMAARRFQDRKERGPGTRDT